jgi:hypothetical protein
MFFHLSNIPVKPPPPSDSEDAETLLPSSRPNAHTRKCQRKWIQRDLCLGLKSCVVTSCVWLLMFVVVLNNSEKRLMLESTDEACLSHISQTCKKLLWANFKGRMTLMEGSTTRGRN